MVRNASQERVRNASQERESGTCPEISPRLRAVTRLRIAALGGFGPSQARPQQAPLDGAALVVVLASVAAWAALDPQLTPDGVALVALRIAALGGFGPSQARPQHALLDRATLVVVVASVAALLAALVALVGGSHQLALWGAALMMSVPLGY